MLMPMSPLPTASGTIDIGAELRPRPPGSGAGACLVHQTMPATTSRMTMDVRTKRRRRARFGGLRRTKRRYFFEVLNRLVHETCHQIGRVCAEDFSHFVAGNASRVRWRPYLNVPFRVVALTIGKNCTFGPDRDCKATIKKSSGSCMVQRPGGNQTQTCHCYPIRRPRQGRAPRKSGGQAAFAGDRRRFDRRPIKYGLQA